MEDTTGVQIPTGSSRDWGQQNLHTAGALFADDCVGLSPTIGKAATFAERITSWSATNEMAVGIPKCGVMEFLPDKEAPAILTEEHPARRHLSISGQLVPVVLEYLYLGLQITSALDIPSLVNYRVKVGRKTVLSLLPFLSCNVLPMSMRLRVVQAVIMPRLLFGAEVYGMNRALTTKMQTLLNMAYKAILGISRVRNNSVPSVGLWCEMLARPVCATAAGRRARAYRKCFSLSTTVGTTIRHPLKSRKWTWSSGTLRWYRQHCDKFRPFIPEGNYDLTEASAMAAKILVEECITYRETQIRRHADRSTAASTVWYLDNGEFADRPLLKTRIGGHPLHFRGLAWVVRFRIGAVTLAPALASRNQLGRRFEQVCPFCSQPRAETRFHLLFECGRWETLRVEHLTGLTGQFPQLLRRYDDARRAIEGDEYVEEIMEAIEVENLFLSWTLGGVHDKVGMRGWSPDKPKEVGTEPPDDSAEASVDSTSSSDDSGSSGIDSSGWEETPGDTVGMPDGTCLAVKLGIFLLSVMRLRAQYLKTPHQFLTGRVFPLSTSGQRPNG